MSQQNDVDLAALRTLSRLLSDLLLSIEDDQWTLGTPCDGWDLAGLVDHITGGNWFSIRILDGQSAESAMQDTMQQFAGGSASKEQALTSVADQLGAFEQLGRLDQICHHVAGELPGRQVVRLRLHDLIVHSWDLSQTISPPGTLPDGLLQWATAELAHSESATATHFGLSGAPPVGAVGSATAYLRYFGR
ncbi:MAG: maleylpyruvate isomerase family mycothiol-dependent enzyme [Acidimicrobiales bacterium]